MSHKAQDRNSQTQDDLSINQPTKRYGSFQQPARLKDSHHSIINTPRISHNIACAFHNDQRITNFCKNKECLLPLCPKCIGQHLQEHSKMGVFGDFVTIDESFQEASTSLREVYRRAEFLGVEIQKQKGRFGDKEDRLNNEIMKAKHKFFEMVKEALDNFEKAVGEIWSIQLAAEAEMLKESERLNNQMLENCNACLKKLMSPFDRLQGIIHYYYHQESFKDLEQIQRRIKSINVKPQLSVECNFAQMNALEAAIKSNITLSTAQEEIWSEFKMLNQKNRKLSHNIDNTSRPIHRQLAGLSLSLDTFISPLSEFSLLDYRSKQP